MTAATLTRPAAQASSSKSAKTKSTAPRLPRPKPAPIHIHVVSRRQGLYEVPSTSYGGHIIYRVSVLEGRQSCECEGFLKWGKTCKHLRACTYWHQCLTGTIQRVPVCAPAPKPNGAAGLLAAFGVE